MALTDGNGELAAYYEYDAWGNTMTEAETSGVDNPYRYSTKEWDEESGLYYFGARYYYPEIGRWTQRDPAGIIDGLNVYSYVANDAANANDPWGRRITYQECLSYAWKSFRGFYDMLAERDDYELFFGTKQSHRLKPVEGSLRAWVYTKRESGRIINAQEERGLWYIPGGCCRLKRTGYKLVKKQDVCQFEYKVIFHRSYMPAESYQFIHPGGFEDNWRETFEYFIEYDECDEYWRG